MASFEPELAQAMGNPFSTPEDPAPTTAREDSDPRDQQVMTSPSAAAQEGARGTVTTATGPGVVVQQATERAMEREGAGAGRAPPRRQREPLQHPSGQPRTYGGYLNSQAPQLPQPLPQVPTVTSGPPGLTRDPPQEGQDMMQRLLEGLEKVKGAQG